MIEAEALGAAGRVLAIATPRNSEGVSTPRPSAVSANPASAMDADPELQAETMHVTRVIQIERSI
jgi:hypothetical protein